MVAEARKFQVVTTFDNFKIEIRDNTIIEADPIAGWMIGKSTEIVKVWLRRNKAKVTEIKD